MRSNRLLPLFMLFLGLGLLSACGGGGGGGGNSGSSSSSCSTPAAIALPNGSSVTQAPANNVMTLTVNGSTCSAAFNAEYPDKPCVSVTICDGSGNNCQLIDDILLDTGDNGLRIFRQVLNSGLLSALENGSNPYECVEYGDGSTVWGQVATARVTLGNEAPVPVPIQVIGSLTSDAKSGGGHWCTSQLTSVNNAGYNGSLGLGVFAQDCGLACQNNPLNQLYFTCNGVTCSEISMATNNQVANPVASLTTDKNGVIVSLPTVPSTGAASASGYVILGIGTQANNIPSGVTAYGVNGSNHFGSFTTTFNGGVDQGFLDTGSNGIFFTYSTTTDNGFYTPSCTLSLSATNTGASNAPNTNAVAFNIADADSLFASSNNVFSNLGGPIPNDQFDWGIPFFLGRNVYIGIEGTASSLASGPYWAY